MNEERHQFGARVTFRELFERDNHGLVQVPIIQRDFAQGRESQTEIRTAFLDAIFRALSKEPSDLSLPLDLDFVYGSIDEVRSLTFYPLDGQQRLTTLFLLHWYLAYSDKKFDEFRSFMTVDGKSRFTYEVRPSSREFFDALSVWSPLDNWPQSYDSLRTAIEDQPWFFHWWKRDPTIKSALNMLDAIHEKFKNSEGFYDRIVGLDSPYITFQLLDLANFGLSDDLYIKMNARGKPLTAFEVFKARLEGHIETVFASDTRKLNGQDVDIKYYFSHQIDTTWADLFWTYRDLNSLYDNEVMNLVRALAIVTRAPDEDDFDNVLEELRGSSTFSFQKYLDLGILDKMHIELLITLLDHFSGAAAGKWNRMSEQGPFQETTAFRNILQEGERSSYRSLLQFYAYAGFIRVHETSLNSDRLEEWMRVISNLTVNSNIERPEEFKNSLRSINSLLEHSGEILSYLATQKARIQGFNQQQVQEERLKAALILKTPEWKDAILKAEAHVYFKGQIEFLLDFCGVLQTFRNDSTCGWPVIQDKSYLKAFQNYFAKASLIFDQYGLKRLGTFRTERALIAIGDYMFGKGQNSSFLENAEGPISWKLLLRGDQLNQPGKRRGYLKAMLDDISLSRGVENSLDAIIDSVVPAEQWRRLLAINPALISYCEKRQIRFYDPGNVYLLKGLRRSGDHVELVTYHLYTAILREKFKKGNLAPFNNLEYRHVYTDLWEPTIYLSGHQGRKTFSLEIWNYGSLKFRFELTSNDAKLIKEAPKPWKGIHEEGKLLVNVELDPEIAEKQIEKIVRYMKQAVNK